MRGTAVVASNIGGLAEIVQHEQTGLLVPPDDLDALVAALLQLLQNRALAEQFGGAGYKMAQTEFSVSTCIDKFVSLYDFTFW